MMMHVSMKFHEILTEKGIFDILSLLVTFTLEVGIYMCYSTHHLVITHVSMKFHEILFVCLEVVVRTKKRHI